MATPIHMVIVIPASANSPASGLCETTSPTFGSSKSTGHSSCGATMKPLDASIPAAIAGDSPITNGISTVEGPVETCITTGSSKS